MKKSSKTIRFRSFPVIIISAWRGGFTEEMIVSLQVFYNMQKISFQRLKLFNSKERVIISQYLDFAGKDPEWYLAGIV